MLVTASRPAANASAAFLWKKLAAFSSFEWHPEISKSEDVGKIPDGSPNMVGATRLLTKPDGSQLREVVTAWDEKERSQTFSIEGNGLPPPIETFLMTFHVVEDETSKAVSVEATADIKLHWYFAF